MADPRVMRQTDDLVGQLVDRLLALEKRVEELERGTEVEIRAYGSIYGDDISQSVTISASGVYYRVGGSLSAGMLYQFTFQNSREVVCGIAGTYRVVWGMSVQCASANQEISGAAMVNGTEVHQAETSQNATTANKPVHISGTGLIALDVGDVVALCVENETGTASLVVTHANLTLVRAGL